MTDLAALDALIEAVTAGQWDQTSAWKALGIGKTGRAERTFNGSLDAAKALHDSLLPGWIFLIGSQVAGVSAPDHEDPRWWNNIHNGNHARGWLIATLKAYRAGL